MKNRTSDIAESIRIMINRIPFPALLKLNLYRKIHQIIALLKKLFVKNSKIVSMIPLAPMNASYGHEYWFRKYSNYDRCIYAMIEHGLYFGKNISKVGEPMEWDIGSIITYGNYRKELLNKYYPKHYVLEIGPYIHYADIDNIFLNEIQSKLIPTEKTITIFPAHSLPTIKANFDIDEFVSNIKQIAETANCKNIIICLHPTNYKEEAIHYYSSKGFIVVSAGGKQIHFLSKLKTIITISDITASNSLGTQIGYCIYLNKPHILFKQEVNYLGLQKDMQSEFDNRGDHWLEIFEEEKKTFFNEFSIDKGILITDSQRELCETYWGISKILSKERLKIELKKCKEYSKRYQHIT